MAVVVRSPLAEADLEHILDDLKRRPGHFVRTADLTILGEGNSVVWNTAYYGDARKIRAG
ncbi:MAG: hypothetical protein ACP5XB_08530 [Isosphaeraceae bacterium]